MLGGFCKRAWRATVGLTVAYALVLQAFLAYGMASQAAAQDSSAFSGSVFILCTSQDDYGAAHDSGAPVKLKAHCPVCTLSGSSVATLTDPPSLPVRQAGVSAPTAFVSVTACISFHRARAGLSRAPPQNA
jgi:hypothetical protein